MFSFFNLVYLLYKVFLYALIYSVVIFGVLVLLSKIVVTKWIKKITSIRIFLFLVIFIIVFMFLFFYSFSFWRDRGIGDYSRIPISNGYEIGNSDNAETIFEFLEKNGNKQAHINKFIIQDEILCAEFDGYDFDTCTNCLMVFDTKNDDRHEFRSAKEYSSFAFQNNLPQIAQFKTFYENYNEYWKKHNRWYLP